MILFIFFFIHDIDFLKRKVAYFGARRSIKLTFETQFFMFNSGQNNLRFIL